MRIAMLSPLDMRVPPVAYGGTELIVSLLTEGLVERGHDVTLFASGDSRTAAKLECVCPCFLRGSGHNASVLNLLNVACCLEKSADFDIIHNHTLLEGMSLAGLINTPMLTTLHGAPDGDLRKVFQHYKGWYNTISHSGKTLLSEKERFAGVVYNAIDTSAYPFNGDDRDDYLLFLSRISPEKGPHLAIEVARRLGRRLIIAGNVDRPDEEFFRTQILPQVDGDLIRYVGEADFEAKCRLMCRADCLLAPITWNEPFGLFLIEAMTCGTPVVGLRKGSIPEVVCHNETGFVVDDLDGMVDLVPRVSRLNRARCRRHVEENFSVSRMVDSYLAIYERILSEVAESGPARPGIRPAPGRDGPRMPASSTVE